MLKPPYEITSCSWPRPIEQRDNQCASEPEWDAQLVAMLPQPHWELLNDELCWMINWRDVFKQKLKFGNPGMGRDARLLCRLSTEDQW